VKIVLRNITYAGNNVRTDLFLDEVCVSPAGLHMNREEYDNFVTVLSNGCKATSVPGLPDHTFEVDDR
jgi:hypothetical protein